MNTLLVSAYLLSSISQYTTGIESFPEYAKHRKTISFAKIVSELRFLAFTIPVSIQALKNPQSFQTYREPVYGGQIHPTFPRKRQVPTPKMHFAIKFTSTEIPLNKTLHLSEGLWDVPPHEKRRNLLANVSHPLPFWYTE